MREQGENGILKVQSSYLVAIGLLVSLALPAVLVREASASEPDQIQTRISIEIDNSGSMRRAARFRRSVQLVEHWVEGLHLRVGLAVDLFVAADHVVHEGSYSFRDENERGRLLDHLRELHAERHTRTVFRRIDDELATFVEQHARPEERLGFIFVTDGQSDEPESDLSLPELGDQVLSLGNGLYAVVSGAIPQRDALIGRANDPTRPVHQDSAKAQGKCRRLLAPSISFERTPPVLVNLRERLLGGYEPVSVTIAIGNSNQMARAVQLQVRTPDGVSGHFVPSTVVLPGRERTEALLELAVTSPISGPLFLTAQGPDGNQAEAILKAEITTMSWLDSNWMAIAGFGMMTAMLFGILVKVTRRAWYLVPIGWPDRGFYLRPGDESPLSAADPGFPSGTSIKRRRGGLWLRTDGEPMRVGGVAIQVGRDVRYRLHTPIEAGTASVVLDIRSHREAANRPVIIAGASERATACDDLL